MPMTHYERRCSECENSLAGKAPTTKTCSDPCRNRRSRRLAKENAREVPPEQKLAQALQGEYKDAAHEVIQQQLAPVVREAMTEDVLSAIQSLVGLTPAAVRAIEMDLGDEDSTVRQRAYTLLLKYTVGHPAVVQARDADPNQQMVVHFNLPRPEAVVEADATEYVEDDLRTCDECGKEDVPGMFIGASDRCTACYDKRQADVLSRFGDDA